MTGRYSRGRVERRPFTGWRGEAGAGVQIRCAGASTAAISRSSRPAARIAKTSSAGEQHHERQHQRDEAPEQAACRPPGGSYQPWKRICSKRGQVLERNHRRLERAEQQQRNDRLCRDPEQQVDERGRMEQPLTSRLRRATMMLTMRMMNTAGPSPLSAKGRIEAVAAAARR